MWRCEDIVFRRDVASQRLCSRKITIEQYSNLTIEHFNIQ